MQAVGDRGNYRGMQPRYSRPRRVSFIGLTPMIMIIAFVGALVLLIAGAAIALQPHTASAQPHVAQAPAPLTALASISSRVTTASGTSTATDVRQETGTRSEVALPGASVATIPETESTDGFERYLAPATAQPVSSPFIDAFEDQMSDLGRRVRQVVDLSTIDYEIVSVTALQTEDSATRIAQYYRQQMSQVSWSTYADFGDDTLLVLQSNPSPDTYLVIAPVDGSKMREYVPDFHGVVLFLVDVN